MVMANPLDLGYDKKNGRHHILIVGYLVVAVTLATFLMLLWPLKMFKLFHLSLWRRLMIQMIHIIQMIQIIQNIQMNV